MARWGFVRHGESEANAGRWIAGHIDAPLTDLGRAQAREAHLDLSAWARVVSSDLTRAHLTSRLAAPEATIQTFSELRERTLGAWDGRAIDRLKSDAHWPTLLTWDEAPPGGESNKMLAVRTLTWLSVQPDIDTLVFAHGGVIRTITGLLDGHQTPEIPLLKVKNAELLIREATPAIWLRLLDSL